MTPVLRVASWGASALSVLLAGAGAGYYFSHRTPDLTTSGTQVASVPHTSTSIPGDPQLPDSEDAYRQFEQQNRLAAQQNPGPAASVPPIDPLQPAETLNPPAVEATNRLPSERDQNAARAREQAHQAAIDRQAQDMAKVLAAWGGVHKTVEASLKPPEPENEEDRAIAAVADPLALAVDKVYYGILQVFISSDEPGPVVVTIKDGHLNGARLIGSFKRADEKVIIQFDRMTFQNAWYTVDAVAINPDNGRLGLATDVDRRTFSRWAALLGSAVLQGAQRAYLSQGTQTSYPWGESQTRNYSDQEILGIALGEIGTRTRSTATQYFDRPPTVYVDPAIQLVGVLFMAPPSRKTSAAPLLGGAATPPASTPQNTRLRRAARAALTATPPAPAVGAVDPARTTANYTTARAPEPAVSRQPLDAELTDD